MNVLECCESAASHCWMAIPPLPLSAHAAAAAAALQGHLCRVGEERCAFVRPMVFANRAMAGRTHMEAQVEDWLAEAGVTPPGNGVEAHLWGAPSASASEEDDAAASFDVSLLSPAERAEYEERKLKLRKAMVRQQATGGPGAGGRGT